MNVKTARKLYEQYKKEVTWDHNHANEDALVEITQYLARETKNPWYTSDLGGYYYAIQEYDLALKYYELTYSLGDRDIACCMGYIWYYGRTGVIDYEKAYRYFKEAADLGNDEAKRKLADMYKNGYFVAKNYSKYCRIIESLYEAHKEDEYKFQELPDLCTRLAEIRKKEGNIAEAVSLYQEAREYLPIRLSYTGFFGDINVMDWLINNLYTLIEVDYSDLDVFDLFYVLKKPGTVKFRCGNKQYEIVSMVENGEYAVGFNGRWYRSVNDLFRNATLEGKPVYALYQKIYNMEAGNERTY